jgi:ring-1,2-phenylacetyl-CoA epoxidase subunit PaaD
VTGDPRTLVAAVPDPELPVVTLADLGIVRDVRVDDDGAVRVVITPTYTGCPAMATIADDIRAALAAGGFPRAEVRTELAPAWSTNWITESGRAKLAAAGIAPPAPTGPAPGAAGTSGGTAAGPVPVELTVRCPLCGSTRTRLLSRFGSTACQAARVCQDCGEAFGHVKPL